MGGAEHAAGLPGWWLFLVRFPIVPYAACDTPAQRRVSLADQAPRKPTERVATPYDRPRGGGKVREPEG